MELRSETLVGELPVNAAGKIDLGVETVFVALAILTTGLRLWSRRLIRASLQINDVLIIAALVLLVARYTLEMTLVLKCGLGLHADEIERIAGPEMIVLFRKLVFAIDLMWLTLVALVKTSILQFYASIFRNNAFVRSVYATIGLVVAFWCAAFFADVFFCDPVHKSWLPETPGRCGNSILMYIVLASTDLTIDVIILLLPMPILWSLQLPTPKKLALTFVFGLGFGIIAITSVRIKYFFDLDPADITYTFSKISLLSSMVPILGIINANLPILGPAFKRIFNSSLLTSTVKKSNMTTSSASQFRRIADGEYPLVNIDAAPGSRSTYGEAGISVTKEFNLRTTERGEEPRSPFHD
ncbi:hypothetical protein KJ359_004803 [Pestalotiopsis sp. 9143b]|nr:hypothetical protein KJ359_004803 [Pestalotiopsis sp. 9143b]